MLAHPMTSVRMTYIHRLDIDQVHVGPEPDPFEYLIALLHHSSKSTSRMNWPTSLIFSVILISRGASSMVIRKSFKRRPLVILAKEQDCHRND